MYALNPEEALAILSTIGNFNESLEALEPEILDLEVAKLLQAVRDSGVRDAWLLRFTTLDDAKTFLELSQEYKIQ